MRKKRFLSLCMVATLVLASCSSTTEKNKNETNQSTENAEATSTVEPVPKEELDVTTMFTERDTRNSYDESSAVSIQLQDNQSTATSNAVTIKDNVITITKEGVYVLSGTLSDGRIEVAATKNDKVQLVLNGVTIHSKTSAPIYVSQANKVFITLKEGSTNTLTNGGSFTSISDDNIDGVIFSKDDLTVNGTGLLSVDSPAGHGIVSKDDLVIGNGVYQINAQRHGLVGKDSVRIANGEFVVTAGKDGIHSNGDVSIADGTFDISTEDDGIHADATLTILDGTITIHKSYEGLEGNNIAIKNGMIRITASDDGLNAAGGNDESGFMGKGGKDLFNRSSNSSITISDGTLYVNAEGDGIDSNGNLTISGGATYVSGPTRGGNGALDYGGEGVITGGIVVAAGTSGMAQNFGTSSTQGAIMISIDQQSAGSNIILKDADDKELLSWKSEKAYSSVVISSPEIVKGSTYTIAAGTTENKVTMDDIIYGSGGMGGPGGAFDKGGFGGGDAGMGPGQRPVLPPDGVPNIEDGQRPKEDFQGQFPGNREDTTSKTTNL